VSFISYITAMEVSEKQVETYLRPDGSCPFEDWMNSLRDKRAKARIRTRIGRVRLGNLGDRQPVGGGVMELKIDYGPGYRVYLGHVGVKLVILLCGGDKSSQREDIKKAIEYWEDYKK
jgi:putative addiction module killer protein